MIFWSLWHISNEITVRQPLKIRGKFERHCSDLYQLVRDAMKTFYDNLSPLNDLLISLLENHQRTANNTVEYVGSYTNKKNVIRRINARSTVFI